MDHGITINELTGVAELSESLAEYPLLNKAFTSLEMQRGTFFADETYGSRLHLLKRSKATERTRRLAEDYAKEALKWLTDESQASAVDISSDWLKKGTQKRLALYIAVTPMTSDEPLPFSYFIDVI